MMATQNIDVNIEDMTTDELERIAAGESPVRVFAETRRPTIGELRYKVSIEPRSPFVWEVTAYGDLWPLERRKFFSDETHARAYFAEQVAACGAAKLDEATNEREDDTMTWIHGEAERRKEKRRPWRWSVMMTRYPIEPNHRKTQAVT